MKNDEMNTAKMQTIARSRGITVSSEPSRTANASGCPCCKWLWMFSIATVASSTRIPMASANPPKVITLIVCPVSQSATTAAISANGMFNKTIRALRQSRRNSRIISPTSTAPSAPSLTTPQMDRVT